MANILNLNIAEHSSSPEGTHSNEIKRKTTFKWEQTRCPSQVKQVSQADLRIQGASALTAVDLDAPLDFDAAPGISALTPRRRQYSFILFSKQGQTSASS